VNSHAKRIGWIVSLFFLGWTALAAASALPGNEWLRGLFAFGCHQEAERCYSIAGHPLGLCVRCLWIYLGLAAGHPFFARVRISEKPALRLLFVSAALVVADVLLEALGVYHNWKALRAATGGVFGFACSWFALRGLIELSLNSKNRMPCHESN
jgi:uncharacterized membrane protein